jgi:hypothetical protein
MGSSLAVEADEGATVATGRSGRTYYYEQLLASSTRIPMPARSPRRERIVARKSPRQARSERTVATILEAAARVLARDSLDGFNTNRVAEVAGLSIGSLYQYFPNKSALIAALIRRAHDELADALELAVLGSEGGTLESSLASLVRVAIDQQSGHCSPRRWTTRSCACPSSPWSPKQGNGCWHASSRCCSDTIPGRQRRVCNASRATAW